LSDSRCLFLIYVERGSKESRRGGNGGQSIQRVYTKTMRGVKKEKTRKELAGILMRNGTADGETQRPLRPSSPVRLSERTDTTYQISSGS